LVTHADEVAPQVIDRGELRGTRRRLGAAAGAVRTGLSRYGLAAGERAMPVHVHADEEELFVVLAGSGLSWQDGATYAVGAGDVVVHRAGAEAHTILAAPGGEGLDVLAFGSGSDTGLTWLPRARAWWAGPHWLPHDGPSPFRREVDAGPLHVPPPAAARPATIVSAGEVPERRSGRGDVDTVVRDLGRAAGSVRCGLRRVAVAPGTLSAPPHCHSVEEELFYVVEGDGTLELGDERHAVRAGSVVARPAGTGVAHAFRAGAGGLTLLAFGTREPGDAAFYPRAGKVALRGLGVRFRITEAEYWEGEA